jgi:hypothetical protein
LNALQASVDREQNSVDSFAKTKSGLALVDSYNLLCLPDTVERGPKGSELTDRGTLA